jgi:hypothetical protein
MKKMLAFVVTTALTILPLSVRAQVVEPVNGDITGTVLLSQTAAPAVEFEAPGSGYYALDSISFYLRQVPELQVVADDNGAPMSAVFPAATKSETYYLTVKIWKQAAGTDPANPEFVEEAAIDAEVVVDETGAWHEILLNDEPTDVKVVFTGSIRIGVFLQKGELPAVPVHLGTSSQSFGMSFTYTDDPLVESPWAVADPGVNHAIDAAFHSVPTMSCVGFQAPLNKLVTMKKGGRTLPLKVKLFDADGAPIKRRDLVAAPLVQLLLNETDPTDQVIPAGKCNKGQAFRSAGKGKWIYNLKTKNLGPGIYRVLVGSGDTAEYMIEPACTASFVIEEAKTKKQKPEKGQK